jgi:hypothetical protein
VILAGIGYYRVFQKCPYMGTRFWAWNYIHEPGPQDPGLLLHREQLFGSIKWLVLSYPQDGMLVHHRLASQFRRVPILRQGGHKQVVFRCHAHGHLKRVWVVDGNLKPHCIRCSYFKVDDVNALEPSSKPPVRIVEDNVTASLHQQRTPWLRPGCCDDATWIC